MIADHARIVAETGWTILHRHYTFSIVPPPAANSEDRMDLRTQVFEALDNAVENEYDEFTREDPEVVARDLLTCDASFEGFPEERFADLVRLVEQWQSL